MKKTVLITGASSGIGKDTAEYFSKKGWNVVATMRHPEKRKVDLDAKVIDVVHLDVLDLQSVKEAIRFTIKKYGKIDALVNNAGYALQGVFEVSTREEVEKQYATNVLGLMDVTREIIPVFRDQNGGTIINVASVGGRIGFPFYSIYNSSKWAVEGFSEAMHYELRPLNIRVKIIEPGVIKTDFYDRSLIITKHENLKIYNEHFQHAKNNMAIFEKRGSSPMVIAKLIYKAAQDKGFKLRYSGGSGAKMLFVMRKILPDRLVFAVMRTFAG